MKPQNVYYQYADFDNPIVFSKLEPTLGEAGENLKIKGLKVTEIKNRLPVVVFEQ